MDFDEAIKAHSGWKMKLAAYLAKPDGSLKAATVEPDNNCALGKWIYAEGARLSAQPEFITLKAEHARFHKCAAAVIRKADTGQKVAEEIAVGANSDFGKASSAVVFALMTMKRKQAA